MKDKVQLNKYDLAELVANIIGNHHILCRNCLFKCENENESPKCWSKDSLIKEIIKKFNL